MPTFQNLFSMDTPLRLDFNNLPEHSKFHPSNRQGANTITEL